MYLEENYYSDYSALSKTAKESSARFYELKKKVKEEETRLAEIQTIKTHIINYSKTREVYVGYRKAGYSKKYLVEHEGDIILHKAAKKAFDELGLKKLPTVKSLQEEWNKLLSQKKEDYAEYKKSESEMRELTVHAANSAIMLGIDERKEEREKERQHCRGYICRCR